MGALFNDRAFCHDNNVVGVLDGRQTMGNCDSRTSGCSNFQSGLDDTLRFCIQSTGGLVE